MKGTRCGNGVRSLFSSQLRQFRTRRGKWYTLEARCHLLEKSGVLRPRVWDLEKGVPRDRALDYLKRIYFVIPLQFSARVLPYLGKQQILELLAVEDPRPEDSDPVYDETEIEDIARGGIYSNSETSRCSEPLESELYELMLQEIRLVAS